MIGINEMDALDATLTVQVVSASGETVFSREINLAWEDGVSQLFAEKLETRTLRGSYTIRTFVSAEDGSVVTENTCAFDVFSEQELALPTAQIAVLDLDGPFTRFLKQRGVNGGEFAAATPKSTPVFVTNVGPKTPADQKRFADLMTFMGDADATGSSRGTDRGLRRV